MDRLAIDLHGTINDNPELFKQYMILCREFGTEVFVMSGPPIKMVESQLLKIGIERDVHYDGIFSVVNFLQDCGVPMKQDERGNWWAEDEIWWKSKYNMCWKYKISVLIDDKVEYREYFELDDFNMVRDDGVRFLLYGGEGYQHV